MDIPKDIPIFLTVWAGHIHKLVHRLELLPEILLVLTSELFLQLMGEHGFSLVYRVLPIVFRELLLGIDTEGEFLQSIDLLNTNLFPIVFERIKNHLLGITELVIFKSIGQNFVHYLVLTFLALLCKLFFNQVHYLSFLNDYCIPKSDAIVTGTCSLLVY